MDDVTVKFYCKVPINVIKQLYVQVVFISSFFIEFVTAENKEFPRKRIEVP